MINSEEIILLFLGKLFVKFCTFFVPSDASIKIKNKTKRQHLSSFCRTSYVKSILNFNPIIAREIKDINNSQTVTLFPDYCQFDEQENYK